MIAQPPKISMIDGFSSIGSCNWLQGRQLIPLLRRHGREVSGAVLDLGCGASPFRPLFTATSKFIRIDNSSSDPDVIVADASHLPLDDGSIACVLVAQMIGDVADLVALFREIHRVLAPGGRILVYETMSYPQHDLPYDCWRVMPGGLKWLAEKNGFHVESIEPIGGYFTQLSMHWNAFIIGGLARTRWASPIVWLGRAFGNVVFGGLDRIFPRASLATDYFAYLTKPAVAGDLASQQ